MWERVGTKSLTVFLILLLAFALVFGFNVQLAGSERTADNECAVVRVIPEVVELGGGNVTGQTFTIALVVENVSDLDGVDILLGWNTTYLAHVTHTMTMPVENFPATQSPSPYPGLCHSPPISLSPDPPISGAIRVTYATLEGPSFNGSGTAFTLTLRVEEQPQPFQEDVIFNFDIQASLARSFAAGGGSITFITVGGTVIIRPFWNPADVNHDLKVDIYDVVLLSAAYGTTPSDSKWNPNCDIAEPYEVIDIYDVVLMCEHYGEEYTP